MSLFPMLQPAAPSQQTGGLFDNLKIALSDPAVKAGLLQAGMSMLNPNPNASPFAQIFSGVGEGIAAHQRYQDLATQREIDKQALLADQMKEDEKFAMQNKLNQARIAQIENTIRTSQENSKSLGMLRSAQADRARRGPAAADGSKAFSSAWRAFYRKKMDTKFGEPPTPEEVASWKQEFNQLESSGPGGAVGAASSAPDAAAGVADARAEAIRTLVDEDGYTEEEAAALVDSALSE